MDPLYNLRRDQSADNSEYDVFTLKDMKDMAKMLGDDMKPESHGTMFCPSLHLAFWYIFLLSQCTEEGKSIASHHEDSKLKSEACKTV